MIDVTKGIDLYKRKENRKECIVFHYWYFIHGFKFQKSLCNDCYNLLIIRLNISNISTITAKDIDSRCIIYDVSKSDAINLLDIYVLDDQGFI